MQINLCVCDRDDVACQRLVKMDVARSLEDTAWALERGTGDRGATKSPAVENTCGRAYKKRGSTNVLSPWRTLS